ncbi:MAG: right-handed parallel beta-helix repeat-containing protein [Planctomycetota bacterium]
MTSGIRGIMTRLAAALLLACATDAATATEFHVAVSGDDQLDGSPSKPYRTISAAARVAQPGDLITVHAGIYRERIAPPRGGESDARRIVYRAAPGEIVEIRGSEVVGNWVRVQEGVWKTTLPNAFFGSFNPYSDLIHGDWFNPKGREHYTGAVYLDGEWLTEAATLDEVLNPAGTSPLWCGRVDEESTAIWAQFKGCDPNERLTEINVRRTVFYPETPGINYITVRGFRLRHAATPWAPPTAEQIGLIGTHWSKGWIIERNEISHSTCSGLTLGKYGDEWDNTSANTAEGYVKTIERALENGWTKETIGHHLVRDNTIHDCEQTGICGSLGAIFSQITGNHIYDIWTRRQFTGAEMGGIKIHASIDMLIQNNRIHNAGRGIWMDWMAQGTRLSGNLLYDNTSDDLFVEVNHGPFLVDNNLLLSPVSLRDWSQGGAYAHNLFAGVIDCRPELDRETPYHPAHSTAVAGLSNIQGGDDRFYNNILLGGGGPDPTPGLSVYDEREFPLKTGGNVYFGGARPYGKEKGQVEEARFDPGMRVVDEGDRVSIHLTLGPAVKEAATTLVTTSLLGNARISRLPYENPDGSPLILDTDYVGKKRDAAHPSAGPFENPGPGALELKVWGRPIGQDADETASLEEAVDWLATESNRLIRAARREMKSGIASFPPQVGIGYEAFWLRDYAYMLEGRAEAFTEKELRDACLLFVNALGEDGSGVDCVKYDGTPIYMPGYGTMGENPVTDGGMFTVAVAWHTYRRLGDRELLESIVDRLALTMDAVPRNPETGLVHIEEGGWDRCPYGFTDTVRKQGDLLFSSLLWIEAAGRLTDLLRATDRLEEATRFQEESEKLTKAVREVLFDDEIGLFRAATRRCAQPDLWGSAFAVHLGIASEAQALRIARYFQSHYGEIVQHGQLRHLPGGEYWEEGCGRDQYQNGAYWATPAGWLACTLDLVDPELARRTILDLVADFQHRGVNEWVLDETTVLRGYVASATLPLAGARTLLERSEEVNRGPQPVREKAR